MSVLNRGCLEQTGRNSQESNVTSRPASVAANSFEDIGAENPQFATSVVDNTLFFELLESSVRTFAAHAGEPTQIGLRKRNRELDSSVASMADEIGEIQQPCRQASCALAARPLERDVDDPTCSLSECPRKLDPRSRVALEQVSEECRVAAQDGGSHDRYRVERLGLVPECSDVADDVTRETEAEDGFASLRVGRRHLDDAGAHEMNSVDEVAGEIEPFTGYQGARNGPVDQVGSIARTQGVDHCRSRQVRHRVPPHCRRAGGPADPACRGAEKGQANARPSSGPNVGGPDMNCPDPNRSGLPALPSRPQSNPGA